MSPRGVIIIRNADGSARMVREGESLSGSGPFQPNARQALVKCQGDASASTARELRLTILGTARSGIEPLSRRWAQGERARDRHESCRRRDDRALQ